MLNINLYEIQLDELIESNYKLNSNNSNIVIYYKNENRNISISGHISKICGRNMLHVSINRENALHFNESHSEHLNIIFENIEYRVSKIRQIFNPFVKFQSTNNDISNLQTIIPNSPWLDGFTIGAGVNAITGDTASTALKPFSVLSPSIKSSMESYKFIRNENELKVIVDASASGWFNIEGVKVNRAMDFLTKIKYSDLSSTLIATYQEEFPSYSEALLYELSAVAKGLVNSPDKFRSAFGDYFISGAKLGSRFLACYVFQSDSRDMLINFENSIGADVSEVFSANGALKILTEAKNYNITISIDIFMDGWNTNPTSPVPTEILSPEGVVSALAWFKQNTVGIPMRAKLTHYSSLDLNIPTEISISPDIFIELRALYSDVWHIRTNYASCPQHYRNELTIEYDKFVNGVVAYQSQLATDMNKREEFVKSARDLKIKLENIFDRQAFYSLLQVTNWGEPAKDTNIDPTEAKNLWQYGKQSYEYSENVKVSSETQDFNEEWRWGYQEHTFHFNNSEKIIVGFTVQNMWGDDDHGYWKKLDDNVILQSDTRIHVSSGHLRGCHWRIKWFTVDKKDYLFN